MTEFRLRYREDSLVTTDGVVVAAAVGSDMASSWVRLRSAGRGSIWEADGGGAGGSEMGPMAGWVCRPNPTTDGFE